MARSVKARVFSREFKLKALERILEGESLRSVAQDLGLARKVLYQWKSAYRRGGAKALRSRGRPRRSGQSMPAIPALRMPTELSEARAQIQELERKIGQQEVTIDFFGEALRRIENERAKSEPNSTNSSARGRRKAK